MVGRRCPHRAAGMGAQIRSRGGLRTAGPTLIQWQSGAPSSRAHAGVLRENEGQLQPNEPSGCAFRTLDVVVGAELHAQRLLADLECLARIHAHGDGPPLAGGSVPISGHGRIKSQVPAAFEIVADYRLDGGLADIITVAVA